MSRLAYYLKKLRNDQEVSETLLMKERSTRRIFPLKILFISLIFLLSSILAGFILNNLLQYPKKERPIAGLAPLKQINHDIKDTTQSNTTHSNTTPQIANNSSLEISKRERAEKLASLSNNFQTDNKSSKLNKNNKEIAKTVKTSKASQIKPLFLSNKSKGQSYENSKNTKTPSKEREISTISPPDWTPLRRKELYDHLLISAEIEREKGNIEEALRLYKEYTKYKEDPDVLNNIASLYMLKGEHLRAKFYLERALKLKRDPVYELNYLISLIKQGRVTEACDKLKVKEYPPYLGETLENLKKFCGK